MASNKSALKRNRQSEKKKLNNKHYKTMVKTHEKKLLSLIDGKKKKEAKDQLGKTLSVIDKVRIKGILHKNTASRKISRLTRLVESL